MTHLPPASLLRLKEGEVVRLCGLAAAASGLEAAARHEVREARRTGARLEATVVDERASRVWVEITGETTATGMVWHCSSDLPAAGTESGPGATLGCAHVAAVLTAWIRAPGDFTVPTSVEASDRSDCADDASEITDAGRPSAPPTVARLAQPRLLSASESRRRGTAHTSLAGELARLSGAEAMAIARRVLGVEPEEREARVLLAATLTDPKRLMRLVEHLDPDARLLFSDILLLGGAMTAADLDARAQRIGQPPSAGRADVAVLERHALVFRAAGSPGSQVGPERSLRQVAGWRIPLEIRQTAEPGLPLPPLTAAGEHGPPILPRPPVPTAAPADGHATARASAIRVKRGSPRHLALALALLARAPAPYNPFAPRRERQFATTAIAPQDRPAVHLMAADLAPSALGELARGANVAPGLARLARRVLLWSRESGADGGLRDLAVIPLEERPLALLAGFRAWRAAEAPAELADLNASSLPVRVRLDAGHAALRPAALAAEAAEARSFILRLLERAQPGVWYAMDGLLALIWRVFPLFLRGRQLTYSRPAWWIERISDGRPLRPTIHDEWLQAEGVYVRELLTGPLFWWGALDMAFEPSHVPVAFRLTPFGANLLGRQERLTGLAETLLGGEWGPAVLLTRERSLAVQPFAAGSELLTALEGAGDVSTIAGGRLVYTLSLDRVAASLDAGATFDALLRVLRTLDTGVGRVAASVESQLATWRDAHNRSRIECGSTLIEAQDEAILIEALAYAPEIAARCRRLGPAVALATPADGDALREILTRRGYHL